VGQNVSLILYEGVRILHGQENLQNYNRDQMMVAKLLTAAI